MIAPTYYLCDVHPTTSPMLEKVDSSKNHGPLPVGGHTKQEKKSVTIFRRLSTKPDRQLSKTFFQYP